jgi:hypothetical protein
MTNAGYDPATESEAATASSTGACRCKADSVTAVKWGGTPAPIWGSKIAFQQPAKARPLQNSL